ncbi:MAG TPA: hypothetical protein VME67_20875 [Mycobacterium sp.]|nr:hypothetical protein [Mycobacterium sp.]HTX97074.1 hypothetical protein [Mycobacterium sp.]
MKAQTKTALAVFGGTAAVVLTVGFGGVGVSPTGEASMATTHASSSVAPARPDTTAPGVHTATLAGCVAGLDC